ncbi:MAG: Integrase, catalytic region [Hyphomicrobiales bacterium]|nr:Integrase, catalytic region [Hyphomicrobiales bacterium]
MSRKRWAVVDAWLAAMTCHARQVKQHRETCRALDQGPDRRTAESQNKVPLPVPRHGPVSDDDRLEHDIQNPAAFASSLLF